jgi:hypothetical protein
MSRYSFLYLFITYYYLFRLSYLGAKKNLFEKNSQIGCYLRKIVCYLTIAAPINGVTRSCENDLAELRSAIALGIDVIERNKLV